MSIESKEVRDIHALYQNLHEETARERMQKNKERVKNPFGKTTIGTPDGKELKQGDPGFKAALSNARQTVRDANNKSLGKDNNSSSSSSSSSVVKKETPVVKKETPVVKKDIPPAPKTQRDEVVTKKDTNNTPPAPKIQRDEVVTRGQGNRPIASNPNRQDKEKPTPSIARGQGNRPIASNPNRQGGEPFKKLLQQKSDKENDVGSDGKPVTPGNRGASINVNRDGSPKPKPEIKLKDPGVITPKVATPKVEIPKVETPKVDPKPVKMHSLEKENRARFGDAAIDKLKAKQVDFKKMQANSQLPGADRGAEKAKFIKKYPKSITAQKAAGLRDHYDPEEVAIDENRMASHTAGMSDAQKDAATSSVSRSTADKMGRRSDEAAFKGRKKKTSARYSSTGGKKRKNTTGRGQPEQYRKSADDDKNEARFPYGRSNIVQGKGSFKGLTKEDFDAFDIVLGYLQESGQVDSIDEALYIMMEMDAATIQGIVRDFEILSEEAADKEKDDRLVKYGIGHDGSDKKAGSSRRSGKKPKGKTPLQKETEKKYGKGVSPLDVVKKKIEDEHGKGAIKS